jgi:hypothetical protein
MSKTYLHQLKFNIVEMQNNDFITNVNFFVIIH